MKNLFKMCIVYNRNLYIHITHSVCIEKFIL